MNEQDNKPDRTAIQQAIEKIDIGISEHEAAYEFAKSTGFEGFAMNHLEVTRELISFRDTVLNVLRDTVEKEQRKSDWVDGFKDGAVFNCAMECHPDDFGFDADRSYNEKYPNHGK